MRSWIVMGVLMMGAQCVGAEEPPKEQQQISFKRLSEKELRRWYDEKKDFVVIDARNKENMKPPTLPNAKWLPFDSSDDEIKKALTSKDAIIVIYCCDIECYASEDLAERLTKMGYTNIYDLPEGCKGWFQQ